MPILEFTLPPLPVQVGHVYGRWTIIATAPSSSAGNPRWMCRCECGREKSVQQSTLRAKTSTQCVSCGKKTHGLRFSPEHKPWVSMLQRCENPNHVAYPDYGGRGITVCERWHDFAAFYEDMGPRPSMKHSIERADYSLGYFKENCRWATDLEQGRNKRNNVLLTLNGITKCASEWAEVTGLTYGGIVSRKKLGWSDERILTTPIDLRFSHSTAGKKRTSVAEPERRPAPRGLLFSPDDYE